MPRFSMNPKISVSVVYVAAMFMSIMDVTIVNVALPAIGRQFHEATAGLDSVAVGYLVSLAVFIPAAGWLGDRFGSKRILLLAVAIFTGASVLCGLADSLSQLVFFRVLQGVGGGMMTPVGMAMLFRAFPPAERVRASSILVVPTAIAPALGPVLGGLLVTELSWRWVFFVNLPFGIVAILFGLLFLEETRQPHPGAFDLPGFLLAGVGFALVMFGISEGPDKGWGSAVILGSIAVGAVLLVAMVWVELRTSAPILKLRLFGNRLFRSTSLVLMVGMAAFLGVLFVMPLFFQIALGLSALQSGLNTFPEAIGVMVGAQLASRCPLPPLRSPSGGGDRPGGSGRGHVADDPGGLRHRSVVDAGPHVRPGPGHVPGIRLLPGRRLRHHLPARHGLGIIPVQQRTAAGQRPRSGRAGDGARGGGYHPRRGGPHGAQPGRLPRRPPHGRRHRAGGVDHRSDHQGCRRGQHHGAAPQARGEGREVAAPGPRPAGCRLNPTGSRSGTLRVR